MASFASFAEVLSAAVSANDADRRNAEGQLQQLRSSDPNGLVEALLTTLSTSSDHQHRLQAAVLLRSTAFYGDLERETNVWRRLNPAAQERVKEVLLSCVVSERNRLVRRNICNTIAELACDLIPEKQWPSIGPQLLQLLQSPDADSQQSGLRMLSELVGVLSQEIEQSAKQFCEIVLSLMAGDKSAETRVECMALVVALLDDCLRKVYKKLASSGVSFALLIIDILEASVKVAGTATEASDSDESLAERAFSMVVSFADLDRGGALRMMKADLAPFLNYFLAVASAQKGSPDIKSRADAIAGAAAAASGSVFGGRSAALAAVECKEEEYEVLRKSALELLASAVEQIPQIITGMDGLLEKITHSILLSMLEVEKPEYQEWLETGDEPDETLLYHMGEEMLDRVAAAFPDDDDDDEASWTPRSLSPFMQKLTAILPEFLTDSRWHYRFVGFIAISQTVEYVPLEMEAEVQAVVETVVKGLGDADPRVRFAACQCLGQFALDHAPRVQENYGEELLRHLIVCFDDPVPRVRSHACAAFVNLAEELDKGTMSKVVGVVMEKLVTLADLSSPLLVRQHALTSIAVVAGVLEESFAPYYHMVLKALIQIINETSQDQKGGKEAMLIGQLRCKAVEAASIVGFSVGKEMFAADAPVVMDGLLQLFAGKTQSKAAASDNKTEGDDDECLRDYLSEAIGRMCRVMEEGFVPYMHILLPIILSVLEVKPKEFKDDEIDSDDEDMTYVMLDGGKSVGLRTSLLEEQSRALELLTTIVSVLQTPLSREAGGPNQLQAIQETKNLVHSTARTVVPLLSHPLSEVVEEKALETMAAIMQACRKVCEACAPGTSQAPSNGPSFELEELGRAIMRQISEKVFTYLLDGTKDNLLQTECARGFKECVEAAGGRLLSAQQVLELVEMTHKCLDQSKERYMELAAHRFADSSIEVEDEEDIKQEEDTERELFISLLEILGALMQTHPDEFPTNPQLLERTVVLAERLLAEEKDENRVPGVYIIDDILQHLGARSLDWWPRFFPKVIECISSKHCPMVQAAAYAVQQAAKVQSSNAAVRKSFEVYMPIILERILSRIETLKHKKGKAHQGASDNCVAALGDIIDNYNQCLGDDAEGLLDRFLSCLPLKFDTVEGLRMHKLLAKFIEQDGSGFFRSSLPRMTQVLRVFCLIYKTSFSDDELNKAILNFAKTSSDSALLSSVVQNLGSKESRKLKKIADDAGFQL